MKLNNTNTIMRRVLTAMITALAVVMVIAPARGTVYAAGVDSLSDIEKNSSYGFFVWLSENADTAAEKADAKVAAQILTNTIPSSSSDVIFNDGHILAAHTLGVSYEQLLSQTALGAENDATSLECLRDAIHFVTQGNEYRAKENLAALKISSGLMAMAEVDVNYQGLNGVFGHSNIFASMENLAYLMLDGTWKYGIVGGSADEPYEGWYTEEKANYDSQNGGETGHYETLTDRQGTMYITGFAVRHRFTTESLEANDGKYYDCLMDGKYYSQHFSDNSTSYFYKGGTGVTPEKYEAYLDLYKCSVLGHTWDEGKVTTEPTCTEKGITTYTCDICGEPKTEPIAAKGHNMSKTAAVAPKCTTGGNTEYYTCNVCGKMFSDAAGTKEISDPDSVVIPMLVNINKAQITGIAAKTYTGKALTQKPVVKVGGKTLVAGTNYSIAYKNNVKAGTASVVFSGKGAYGGTITKTFKINKANNTMAAAGRKATVKFSQLKKKNQTVKKASAFNVKKPVGKVTFKVATYDKKAKKKITVSAAGNVTVKKGLKKGTYKVKVKVTAAGTANYKASAKNVTLTIKVK